MLPQQLICIFLLMLSYLRETKIETKTDTPYRKYVYHSLAAAPWRHVSQSQWHSQQHAIWLRAWKHFDFLDDVLNAAWVISKEQREWESDGQQRERERDEEREWEREHCRSERRLGICRRLYATFLILISTQNATKNKSTFRLAFLPYFFLHFFGFFLSKLSARLDVEFFGFDFFFCVYFFFLLNFVLGPLFQ